MLNIFVFQFFINIFTNYFSHPLYPTSSLPPNNPETPNPNPPPSSLSSSTRNRARNINNTRHPVGEKTRLTKCYVAHIYMYSQLMPIPTMPVQPPPTGLKSKIRRVFRTSSNTTDKSFSLVSQLTSAALCASSPVLPKPGDVSPVVKSLLRPLSVPQLRYNTSFYM